MAAFPYFCLLLKVRIVIKGSHFFTSTTTATFNKTTFVVLNGCHKLMVSSLKLPFFLNLSSTGDGNMGQKLRSEKTDSQIKPASVFFK